MAAQSSGRTHTKTLGASDYDEAAYWDTKFANKKDVGEWLNSGDAIIDVALSSLDGREFDESTTQPRVLHLGPGISKLGSRLRDAFVQRGLQGNAIVVGRTLLTCMLHCCPLTLCYRAERRLFG